MIKQLVQAPGNRSCILVQRTLVIVMINGIVNVSVMLIQLNDFLYFYLEHYHDAILGNILFRCLNNTPFMCSFVMYGHSESSMRESGN